MEKLALLSVSDKTGLADFAASLVKDHGFKLLSTGGTAKMLRDKGLPVTDVSEYTGFPEMMEGRVKTLHPKVHGGLLCRRDKPEHMKQAKEHGISMIDLVVVNLYPFEETVAKPNVEFAEAIENIDIGGPSMLRSAAKNHQSVTVVCDPKDYGRVLESFADEGKLAVLRKELALKVFQRTASYDKAISEYLAKHLEEESGKPDLDAIAGFPKQFNISFPICQTLRYGENPHQKAALYGSFLDSFGQLQGKELSFNNIIDISSAAFLMGEFEKPTLAILKHTNPCGVASADDLCTCWDQAFETDKQAPFGGIIVANRTVDADLAERIKQIFCEIVIAPDFTAKAKEMFAKRKNLRLMIAKGHLDASAMQDIRSVVGGVLVQDRDLKVTKREDCKVATKRAPTEEEWRGLMFAWKIVKHVKSNAIVYAAPERTLGIGAGQMSRVDSSRIAVWKAGEAKLSLKGSVMASDAYFPFADGLVAAAEAGATAVIQPGGSIRDEEVIKAANEHNMAMVFTGIRHFRH
jgi:phosphoribosylaminoimidazolecarboxamide formyltransferase / IMP cyclohydrolase